MAQVEIYKIKKTAPLQVREYSVFDYMRNGEKPNPLHYVREWGGEMFGTLPLTIPGKLMLNPPQGYNGGEIKNGDVSLIRKRGENQHCNETMKNVRGEHRL